MHLSGGSHMIERATDGVAFLAVLSWMNPTLLVWLSDVSQLAALATPILGFIWLAIRIGVWVYRALRAAEAPAIKEDEV